MTLEAIEDAGNPDGSLSEVAAGSNTQIFEIACARRSDIVKAKVLVKDSE